MTITLNDFERWQNERSLQMYSPRGFSQRQALIKPLLHTQASISYYQYEFEPNVVLTQPLAFNEIKTQIPAFLANIFKIKELIEEFEEEPTKTAFVPLKQNDQAVGFLRLERESGQSIFKGTYHVFQRNENSCPMFASIETSIQNFTSDKPYVLSDICSAFTNAVTRGPELLDDYEPGSTPANPTEEIKVFRNPKRHSQHEFGSTPSKKELYLAIALTLGCAVAFCTTLSMVAPGFNPLDWVIKKCDGGFSFEDRDLNDAKTGVLGGIATVFGLFTCYCSYRTGQEAKQYSTDRAAQKKALTAK